MNENQSKIRLLRGRGINREAVAEPGHGCKPMELIRNQTNSREAAAHGLLKGDSMWRRFAAERFLSYVAHRLTPMANICHRFAVMKKDRKQLAPLAVLFEIWLHLELTLR